MLLPLILGRMRCSTNVRRIGYIASEITKHGGICLVANIAPYTCDREFNRKLIEQEGGRDSFVWFQHKAPTAQVPQSWSVCLPAVF